MLSAAGEKKKEDPASCSPLLPTEQYKPNVTPEPQVLPSRMLPTYSIKRKKSGGGDPPPCSEGFHRASRRTPSRYVAAVPLAILLPNVPLVSRAPGFIPSKPIRTQQGLKKEGGKMSECKKKRKRKGGGLQDARRDTVQ